MKLGEALGAVAALQQEGPSFGDLGERALQPPRLAGEHQRREMPELSFGFEQPVLVRVDRNLHDRAAPPTIRTPGMIHWWSPVLFCFSVEQGIRSPSPISTRPASLLPLTHVSRLPLPPEKDGVSGTASPRRSDRDPVLRPGAFRAW